MSTSPRRRRQQCHCRCTGLREAIESARSWVRQLDLTNVGAKRTNRFVKTSALESVALSSSIAAYENDVFTRAEPSFLNSRQACLDAHDFSKIEGSPLVGLRSLK